MTHEPLTRTELRRELAAYLRRKRRREAAEAREEQRRERGHPFRGASGRLLTRDEQRRISADLYVPAPEWVAMTRGRG